MAKRGSNGIQEAEANVASVRQWIDVRNARRDWDEYAYSGRINRSALAAELGIAKSVMTQNPKVRALLKAQDKIWFEFNELSREAAHESAEKRVHDVSATNNLMTRRVAELEVEVRQLRKQLAKHQTLEVLVQCGFPGQRA